MNKYTQMICVKGSRLRYHRRNSTNNNYSKMVSFYSQKKLLSYCEINSSLFNRSLILSVSFAYSFTHSLALSFFLQNKVTLYRQCKTSLWMKCALWYALHLSLSLSSILSFYRLNSWWSTWIHLICISTNYVGFFSFNFNFQRESKIKKSIISFFNLIGTQYEFLYTAHFNHMRLQFENQYVTIVPRTRAISHTQIVKIIHFLFSF